MTVDNYYKIITDLIGVRIIVRYRNEWKEIHKLIWDKFYKNNRDYVEDYEKDYFPGKDIFIAEKPIVYYRNGEKKENYEIFGKDIFKINLSDIGYSSIHYIINVNGSYIELQVRTIFDEAWSECDHDFVYKLNASPKKLILRRCSKMLSDITAVADNMSVFIKDYYLDQISEEKFQEQKEIVEDIVTEDIIGIGFKEKSFGKNERLSMDINKVSDVFEIF